MPGGVVLLTKYIFAFFINSLKREVCLRGKICGYYFLILDECSYSLKVNRVQGGESGIT